MHLIFMFSVSSNKEVTTQTDTHTELHKIRFVQEGLVFLNSKGITLWFLNKVLRECIIKSISLATLREDAAFQACYSHSHCEFSLHTALQLHLATLGVHGEQCQVQGAGQSDR